MKMTEEMMQFMKHKRADARKQIDLLNNCYRQQEAALAITRTTMAEWQVIENFLDNKIKLDGAILGTKSPEQINNEGVSDEHSNKE